MDLSLEKLQSAVRSCHKINCIDGSNVDRCISTILGIYSSSTTNHVDNFVSLLRLLLLKGCRDGSMDLVSTIIECYLDVSDLGQSVSFGDNAEDLFLDNVVLLRHSVHLRRSSYFHMAAENGFLDILAYLMGKIKASPIDIDAVDCCGRTPLMVGLKHVKIVEYLIKNGANINHTDYIGWTPLITVVKKFPIKKEKSFDLLLNAGADTTIIDKSGLTVYHYSASLSHPDYLKEMTNRGFYPSCNESGQLLYASALLCQCDFNLGMVIEHSSCFPLDVQLSLKYLAFGSFGCTDNLYCSSNNIVSLSQTLSSSKPVNHKVSLSSSVSKFFGNITEWTEEKELKSGKDLLMQSFVILHRVAGFGSFNFLKVLIDRETQPYRFGSMFTDNEYMSVLVIASEVILHRLDRIPLDWACLDLLLRALNVKKFDLLCLVVDPSKVYQFLINILRAVSIYYEQINRLHAHRSVVGQCYHVSLKVQYKLTSMHKAIINILHLVTEGSLSKLQGMQEIQEFILGSIPPLYLHDLSLSLLIYSIMDGSVSAKLNTPSMIAKVLEGSLQFISSYIHNNTYPLSLSCFAAVAVAREIKEYHNMDLPRHVKVFVSLHDPKRTMKELL